MTTDVNSEAAPIDALLGAYAAGTLSPALHALVASHLEMTGRNASYVAALEGLAARELDAAEPVGLGSGPAMLDRILAADAAQPQAPAGMAPHGDVLPVPLRRLIGHGIDRVRWKGVLPGLKEFHVPATPGEEASLLWIKAGRRMPHHTHEGSEVTLVLKGAFRDKTGRYGPGDIAIGDPELDHRPIAEEGEDCICFAVTDAPLRLTGPIGRVVQRLFGRH